MGKKQHQKDKLYLTCSEWTQFFGGKKSDGPERGPFRRLPFYCCSLSLQPFEHPLCTEKGDIFDLMNIVPWLKKYGTNPITGEKMEAKALTKLTFHKNSEDKYHCPVTFKVFNENAHIVAIKKTGHVYSYEAVERLNIRPKNWKDLLTDEPITRKDIITIQDPTDLDKFNFNNFHHLKHNLKVTDEELEKEKKDPSFHLKNVNSMTGDVLEELYRDYKPQELVPKEKQEEHPDKMSSAHHTTGMVAAGFTSTAVTPRTEHVAAKIDSDELKYRFVKKKGYVRLRTNKGDLNIELHCDMVPRTCENFLRHCQNKYYKGTQFHRSIRNFMIQGGDPTATGKGGESIWGKPFKDEFKPNLTHSGRGVLSMANSGPNSNKSQFFITYRSCNHLDRKHAVFGRVVGGLDTLTAMEKVECDSTDKPQDDIMITDTLVFVDPYEEAETLLAEERRKQQEAEEEERKSYLNIPVKRKKEPEGPKVFKSGVGKYINMASASTSSADPGTSRQTDSPQAAVPPKKKVKSSSKLTDFSAW
ncbi:PREDICTED: peptidyl-prolyl cis-trans isomerase-like 2 [Branchiostoma belcheri]|uniref:RING-type E3 ubiquitin-protein ligase PPIL2 n=1 Tax=Branchiostoma belcheri TaxID=7741 RepID=A0A6P4ZIT5_BRABE|nr:PREDICTED: peptidyl-prolyl cis-trans isomerase-like 2 [Branchiostoma belcheri]